MDEKTDPLLTAAQAHATGWSTPYGGPLGVAQAAAEQEAALRAQAGRYAALRAAAIARARQDQSLAQIATTLGVTRHAVDKAARKAPSGWAADLAQDVDGKHW